MAGAKQKCLAHLARTARDWDLRALHAPAEPRLASAVRDCLTSGRVGIALRPDSDSIGSTGTSLSSHPARSLDAMYASSFFAAALATRFCIGCSACFKNALLRCEYRDLFTLITLTRMLTMSRSLCSLIRGETQPEIGQGTKLLLSLCSSIPGSSLLHVP